MKLNNNGWGLSTFLGFAFVFILMIIVISINAYKIGLNDNKSDIQFNTNSFNYVNVESNLSDSAKRYFNSKEMEITDNSVTYITMNELIKDGYMNSVYNNNYNKCSGYVRVNKLDNDYLYTPYIKCSGDYQTSGYISDFDK